MLLVNSQINFADEISQGTESHAFRRTADLDGVVAGIGARHFKSRQSGARDLPYGKARAADVVELLIRGHFANDGVDALGWNPRRQLKTVAHLRTLPSSGGKEHFCSYFHSNFPFALDGQNQDAI